MDEIYDKAKEAFESVVQSTTKYYENSHKEAKAQLQDLLDVLNQTGVSGTLEVFFSGGGDQGQVDDVYGDIKDPDVYQEVVLWAEKLLTSTDANWWDNEGGSGQLEINIDKGTCEYFIDVNVAVTAVQENFS